MRFQSNISRSGNLFVSKSETFNKPKWTTLKVKHPSNFKLPHGNYVNDKNRFSDKMYADVF